MGNSKFQSMMAFAEILMNKIYPHFAVIQAHRRFRGIELKGVKIYDLQKVTFSTLFKLYIAGLGVLIPKRYHMQGQDHAKRVKKRQNYHQLVLKSAKKIKKPSQFCNRLTYRPPQYVILKLSLCWFEFLVPQSGFCASFMPKNAKEKYSQLQLANSQC